MNERPGHSARSALVTHVAAAWRLRGQLGIVAPEAPPLVFALVDNAAGLLPAVVAAGTLALAVLAARSYRGYRIGPGIGGLVGVAVSAWLSWSTGTAAGSFLADAVIHLGVAGALAVSLVVRRPLVGVAASVLRRRRLDWRDDRSARRGYDAATVVAAIVYATRFAVSYWLYTERDTAWLVAARITMGLPLTLLVLTVALVAVRHADRRLGRQTDPPGPAPATGPPHTAGTDAATRAELVRTAGCGRAAGSQ